MLVELIKLQLAILDLITFIGIDVKFQLHLKKIYQ